MMDGRVPLQEIPHSLRRSSRPVNVTSGKLQTQQPKHCKVISSKRQILRRQHKVVGAKRPVISRRRSSSSSEETSVLSIPEAIPRLESPIPPMVGIKTGDEWLCQPSVAHDVYLHARSMERRHCFSPNYLSATGSRITNEMRATLINWLVEIHGHLKLEPEVLHTTVRLLDAALQHFKVGTTRLQLCGLAVFWLASKLESRPLNAKDLLYLMCYKGDVSILVRMERTVLKLLNFRMQVADPIFFLKRLMLYDENGRSEEFFNTCNYCMDAILHDISVVEIPASHLASAALLAARMIDGRWDWPRPIGYATECWPTPLKFQPLALKMIRAILEGSSPTSTYAGAFKKYASRKRFYGLSESPKFSTENLSQLIHILTTSTVIDLNQ